MKKFQFSVFAMIIMAFVCVGFASCSSDDDNGGGDSALVGKWYSFHSSSIDYIEAWQFNSNGSCKYGEWSNGRTEEWGDDASGRWSTSENTLIITWSDEEGEDVEKYTYTISDDGKTLTLTNANGRITIYSKQ